jgi:hypothetical protein
LGFSGKSEIYFTRQLVSLSIDDGRGINFDTLIIVDMDLVDGVAISDLDFSTGAQYEST